MINEICHYVSVVLLVCVSITDHFVILLVYASLIGHVVVLLMCMLIIGQLH